MVVEATSAGCRADPGEECGWVVGSTRSRSSACGSPSSALRIPPLKFSMKLQPGRQPVEIRAKSDPWTIPLLVIA